ncbi:MAG: hypothetical protein ACJA1C_001531 [Crocinitomicaceae bacterium]|jgi:hypothetical protein
MQSILLTVLISSLSLFGFSQNDFGPTPCDYEHFGIIERVEDSIQFVVEFNSEIDLSNENYTYSIAENYYNIAPDMMTNTLCVIYIEGDQDGTEIQFIKLFDGSNEMKSLIDKIQFAFVTDNRTGLWQTYETKEDLNRLFTLDIRQGIKKEK